MRRAISCVLLVLFCFPPVYGAGARDRNVSKIDSRVSHLLGKMTLEEKIGQLTQFNFDQKDLETQIGEGKVGSVISEPDPGRIRRLQQIAVEKSRLHIPILFGHDVIHGYRTIFPIPLGLASSWDPAVIEKMARVSADEASAAGIRWTFSPMVDVARDPRWGRISEGGGEDTFLQSQLAAAYVRGYQGNDLSNPSSVAACVKHFAGYGAAEAGRDYNSVDMSVQRLREVYLPPFRAAIDAGAPTVMTSFNTLNGIPATADPFILRQVLRREWGFRGLVVSDYNAIPELMNHGVAENKAAAGVASFKAGVDMDMSGGVYLAELPRLVREGKVSLSAIDDAVRRVLHLKFELGLFDHPYGSGGESAVAVTEAHRQAAREIAQKSIVLLKNEGQILPMSASAKTIAVIGPLADSKSDMLGNWYAQGDANDVTTVLTAVQQRAQAKQGRVLFSKVGEVTSASEQEIAEAVATASKADTVLMVLGEKGTMSGEAASRASLELPGDQQKLLERVVATGKPIVLVVMSGRPLVLTWAAEHVAAIVEAWFPGTEAGNAVSDVLFGDVNPSGRLPVTFPRSLGQVPIYYSALSTGRPLTSEADKKYKSAYLDSPNTPLYPFGFGLSYAEFRYSDVTTEGPDKGGNLHVTVQVKNTGSRPGDDIVQVYSRTLVASMSRPVRQLQAFRRVSLAAGESKSLHFTVPRTQLAFWNADGHRVVEPGKYSLFVGGDSDATLEASFSIKDDKLGANLVNVHRRKKDTFSEKKSPSTVAGGISQQGITQSK